MRFSQTPNLVGRLHAIIVPPMKHSLSSLVLLYLSLHAPPSLRALDAASLPAQGAGSKPAGASATQSSSTAEKAAEQPNAPVASAVSDEPAHEPDNFHLKAGKVYEDLQLWKEAESEYLKAGSDVSSDVRHLALEGLRRVRSHPQPLSVRLTEGLKTFGLGFLAVVGTAVVLYLTALLGLGLYRSNQHMEVGPFKAGDGDKLAKEIDVTFARVRAVIADTFSSGRIARSRGSGAINFPVILPSLQEAVPFEEQLPELEIEVSGIKLSNLARLLPFLFRPRFRVVGAATATQHYANVHAEIWERHWWFDYTLRAVRTRRIPRLPNGDGVVELEVFVYHVLLTVMYATY